MLKLKFPGILFAYLIGVFLSWTACTYESNTKNMNSFLKTSGTQILDPSGHPIQLKGIGFGNEVWSNNEVPVNHHSEEDFKRVRDMGFNAIRFYLNYQTFEEDTPPFDDRPEGWDWLDQNIKWAKRYGVYLVLNLHISHGGFQALGDGDGLWGNAQYKDRLVNFWKKLALRCKDEAQIAGFSLMNKPVPTTMKPWQELADRLVREIREIDSNHILFLEQAYFLKDEKKENTDLNFPVVEDDNVVYEFQMYAPYAYTHQLLEWAGLGDEGAYPDPTLQHYLNETPGYDNSEEPLFPRGKSHLEATLKKYLGWSQKRNVPLFMSEFGTTATTFNDQKGGLSWVRDVLSIADSAQLSHSYHAYHEDAYGLYFDREHLPTPENCNGELIELFSVRNTMNND